MHFTKNDVGGWYFETNLAPQAHIVIYSVIQNSTRSSEGEMQKDYTRPIVIAIKDQVDGRKCRSPETQTKGACPPFHFLDIDIPEISVNFIWVEKRYHPSDPIKYRNGTSIIITLINYEFSLGWKWPVMGHNFFIQQYSCYIK